MTEKKIFTTGAVVIVLAVILGALAAHALEKVLNADQLESFKTGVQYQMYHGIALLIIASTPFLETAEKKITFYLFLTGTILFSISIYALVCAPLIDLDLWFLGPVTPVGGLLLITGWVYIIVKICRTNTLSK
ncbi:MAG: DUF423 domain-containing protein [Nonlabens sp.]